MLKIGDIVKLKTDILLSDIKNLSDLKMYIDINETLKINTLYNIIKIIKLDEINLVVLSGNPNLYNEKIFINVKEERKEKINRICSK